jgi:hypothetical protein
MCETFVKNSYCLKIFLRYDHNTVFSVSNSIYSSISHQQAVEEHWDFPVKRCRFCIHSQRYQIKLNQSTLFSPGKAPRRRNDAAPAPTLYYGFESAKIINRFFYASPAPSPVPQHYVIQVKKKLYVFNEQCSWYVISVMLSFCDIFGKWVEKTSPASLAIYTIRQGDHDGHAIHCTYS